MVLTMKPLSHSCFTIAGNFDEIIISTRDFRTLEDVLYSRFCENTGERSKIRRGYNRTVMKKMALNASFSIVIRSRRSVWPTVHSVSTISVWSFFSEEKMNMYIYAYRRM